MRSTVIPQSNIYSYYFFTAGVGMVWMELLLEWSCDEIVLAGNDLLYHTSSSTFSTGSSSSCIVQAHKNGYIRTVCTCKFITIIQAINQLCKCTLIHTNYVCYGKSDCMTTVH